MAITEITRDWGANPSIVRVVSTDSISDALSSSYLSDQAAAISELNNGVFQWRVGDSVLLNASDFSGMIKINDEMTAFTLGSSSVSVTVEMTAAEIIAAYTTPKLLVDAPASDEIYIVSGVTYVFDYGSAQFTGGGVAGVQYDDTANGAGALAHLGVAAAVINGVSEDYVVGAAGYNIAGTVGAPADESVGKGLYFSNKTAVFAAGDSTVKVIIDLSVLKTGL